MCTDEKSKWLKLKKSLKPGNKQIPISKCKELKIKAVYNKVILK